MGTERVLARIPSYMKAGRSDYDLDVQALSPKLWTLTARDSYRPMPDLTAGCIEAILQMSGARDYSVTVDRSDDDGFELHIRWA